MSNLRNLIIVSALLTVLTVALPAWARPTPEVNISIHFSLDLGDTITDEDGTHFFFFGLEEHIYDRIYIPAYWGTYPLYFFGTSVGVTVTVTNEGPSNDEIPAKPALMLISIRKFILNTDGSNGPEISDPIIIEASVANGTTLRS